MWNFQSNLPFHVVRTQARHSEPQKPPVTAMEDKGMFTPKDWFISQCLLEVELVEITWPHPLPALCPLSALRCSML